MTTNIIETSKSIDMKKLAPVFIALLLLMAFVSVSKAQSKIYNPELPKSLVFQWKIVSENVHPSWKNESFTISRTDAGLTIFYGTYSSLAEAMGNMPKLPKNVGVEKVTLIPFFNQESISTADAFALMGNKIWFDITGIPEEDAVSFTVYFDTYITPISRHSVKDIEEVLSFEILPNRTFAYSAGTFNSLDEAETFRDSLQDKGYDYAEVNKFLNGQKLAMNDLEEIFAYATSGY